MFIGVAEWLIVSKMLIVTSYIIVSFVLLYIGSRKWLNLYNKAGKLIVLVGVVWVGKLKWYKSKEV